MIRVLAIFTVLLLAGCASTNSSTSTSVAENQVVDPFDIKSFSSLSSLSQQPEDNLDTPEWTKTALTRHFQEWQSVRYRFGGMSKSGVDCSAFVYLAFLNQFGVKLPRNTALQVKVGETVAINELQPGDLVFFKTGHSRRTRHVGIYLDNGRFMHASSSRGVTTSSLDNEYWATAYWTAKRIDPKLLHRS